MALSQVVTAPSVTRPALPANDNLPFAAVVAQAKRTFAELKAKHLERSPTYTDADVQVWVTKTLDRHTGWNFLLRGRLMPHVWKCELYGGV
jgi:hypothetical protein